MIIIGIEFSSVANTIFERNRKIGLQLAPSRLPVEI